MITRSLICLFWISLISSALYLPKWQLLKADKNTINVFVWGDILSPSVIADFEQETGIKINLSYYSSNEELVMKIKATKGEGYDLIIPSDYAVNILRKEHLLKPLSQEKFLYWNQLNPHLLSHYFDPDNQYSIPFEWELFGLGVNQPYFANHPQTPSWSMIFDPLVMQDYKISMNNDPIEAIAFASFYLYGPLYSLEEEQAKAVENTLILQKPFVAAYSAFRGDYFLATHNVSVAVASSSYILRAKKYCDFVQFVVPQEGTFLTIENFCIPKPSVKEDLVFQLINYLCTPQSIVNHCDTYFLFPAVTHANELLHFGESEKKLLLSSEQDFKKYHFIRSVLSEKETRNTWVSIKS